MCVTFRALSAVCLTLSTVAYGAQTSTDFGFRLIPLAAQSPATPGQVAPLPKLFIKVIDGEGAVNNIKARTAREPVVEVDDENHKPVAGALVTFFVSNNGGPGATFGNQQTLSVMTDENGRATGKGFHPNSQVGQFVIEITATFAAVIAKISISQSNFLPSGSSSSSSSGGGTVGASHGGIFSGKLLLIVGLAAAGTAGLVYGVTRGSSAPSATIGGPGTVTVGASH
jgi:hypothetical protein